MAATSGNPRYLVRATPPVQYTILPSLPPSLPVCVWWKADNILRVELDMPNRTTRDYECPAVAPSLRAALSQAMAEEEEMTVDAA